MSPTAVPLPIDAERLARLAHFLRRMSDVERNYSDRDPYWIGTADSWAARDRQGAAQSPALLRRLGHLYASVRSSVLAATEHGRALAAILADDPDSTFCAASGYALSRVAVETLARAWWILEGGLSPEVRVSRFLANELYGAKYQDDMALEAGWTSDLEGVESQKALVRGWCDELNLNVADNRIGGQAIPSPTAIANLLIADTPFGVNKGVVYQISSGIVHGLSWGLRQSGYELALSDLHSEAIHSRVRQQMPEGAGGVVIASFIATMRRAREQLGWGKITLDAFGEPATQFLNTSPNALA